MRVWFDAGAATKFAGRRMLVLVCASVGRRKSKWVEVNLGRQRASRTPHGGENGRRRRRREMDATMTVAAAAWWLWWWL